MTGPRGRGPFPGAGPGPRRPDVGGRIETVDSSGPIRVTIICPHLRMGGAERQLYWLCRHHDRDRLALSVVHYERPGALAAEIEQLGVRVTYLDRPRVGAVGLLRALRKTIRLQRPDVLLCRLPSACRFGRLAAVGLRVPVVIAEQRATMAIGLARRMFDRLLNRWTTCWIGNSDAVADFVVQQFGFPRERVYTIHNGIDTDSFTNGHVHPALAELRRQGRRIALNLGRLTAAKNQALFLRLADLLGRQMPDLTFVLCGHGECRQQLEAEADRLKLARRCVFLGFQKDVPSVLAGADVLVQTSDTEGLPNALMEGMCAGLPVVATTAGGTAEVITDGVDGLLVAPGDERGLIENVRAVLGDPALSGRLGEAGRQTIHSRFAMRVMTRRYEELLERLAAGRRDVPAGAAGETG